MVVTPTRNYWLNILALNPPLNMDIQINQRDLNGLREAVRRNPQMVLSETKKFLTRGIAAYNRIIIRNPWRIGSNVGGAPVDTGNLRDTHRREIATWEARIKPTARYSESVHEGTSKLVSRPWLDFAKQEADGEIRQLETDLLNNVVADLAR